MDGSDSDDSAPPEVVPSAKPKKARANKNRPSEISSRRPVSQFRVAPGLAASSKKAVRDPRFDEHGTFNEAAWRKSYDFVFAKQRDEVDEMKARLAESSSASKKIKKRGSGEKRRTLRTRVLEDDEAASLKFELSRAQNRLREDERRQLQRSVRSEMRKEELDAVRAGKKPFFAKKSVLKERELTARFESLQKEGKLEKYLAKRRKKLGNKQHKLLPAARGEDDL